MRLNKFLAHSGIASRRKCDDLIESGKVTINGTIVRNYSYQVKIEDIIICNGIIINKIPKRRVYLLNKLSGYISTSKDPHKRKLVIDLIPSNDRLFTIGRLDRNTTGAILVTNDGELANMLMHPRNCIERIYIAATKDDIPNNKRKLLLQKGIVSKGITYRGKIVRLGRNGNVVLWKVVLYEGKNHEVKHIFKALGTAVIHLHRQSFANLHVDNIDPGKYRKLRPNEIKQLFNSRKVNI